MPINTPNGTQVSDIILPDGNSVTRVLDPDGNRVFGESAIPDSVVSRGDDTKSASETNQVGLTWSSTVEWPSIGGTLSSNTSGVTRAYIYRESDGSLISDVDISGLSSGDSFTIEGPFDPDTFYQFWVDAEGDSFTNGYTGFNGPYTSSDGQLTIEKASNEVKGTSDADNVSAIKTIGDVGF